MWFILQITDNRIENCFHQQRRSTYHGRDKIKRGVPTNNMQQPLCSLMGAAGPQFTAPGHPLVVLLCGWATGFGCIFMTQIESMFDLFMILRLGICIHKSRSII